ncbi:MULTISPECIES: hypothetical protein [unclassified Bradyrhizobium]|jgi:hypothetical protein|uniref:hypothetical protein n=1 Tax=unclassified Bradyrhizobium TaxID=2631580 RepID=UPI003393F9BD
MFSANGSSNDHSRALGYRKLAMAEQDRAKAAILNRIADEAERGVLCTATAAPLRPATQN